MQESDENNDERLSQDEYNNMVQKLGMLLFDSTKEHLESTFYLDAVKASSPPAGISEIDIYGADSYNVSVFAIAGQLRSTDNCVLINYDS